MQIGEEDEIDNKSLQFSSDEEDDDNRPDGNGIDGINGINNSPSTDAWSSPLFTEADLAADDSLVDEESFDENHQKVLQANTSTRRALSLPPPLKAPLPLHHQRAANLAKVQEAHRRRLRKQAEEEDHRPDSDKAALQPLQLAKEQQRLRNRNHQQDNMTRSTRKRNAENADLHGEGTKNTGQVDDESGHVPRKRPSRDHNESPSMVSTGSDDNPTAAGAAKKTKEEAEENFKMWANKTTDDLKEELAIQKTRDAKLKMEKRLPQIEKLREQVALLRWKRGKDNVRMAKMQVKIEELELDKTKRMSRSQAQKMRVCAEIQSKVEQVTKTLLWRTVKFMTCPEDLGNAVDKVIDFGKFCEGMSTTLKDSFAVTYSQIIKKALNSQRNYLTQELKKIAFKVFLEKNLELPKTDVWLACAMRNVPEVNDPKFKLYWTLLLRTLVDAKVWSKDVYYYTTPLAARMDPNDKTSKKLFTVSHEAMICVVWENNWEKWQDQYKFTQLAENKGKPQPNLPGKWTRSDTGQAEWGGWLEDGLKAYNAYKKSIREGRDGRMDEVLAYEDKILAELRKDVGIEADSHEAQLRMNRAKKRRKNSEKPVAVAATKAIATVDDEDEDED